MAEPGQDWIDKHEASALSGYNARHLTNLAREKKLRAEQRGTRQQWYFWRADIERLRKDPVAPAQP